VDRSFSVRRFGLAVAAFLLVLAIGTIGFKILEEEGWVAAFYRAVVTTTLTGLDTRPRTTGGQVFAIFVLFFGVAIFLYVAGAIVEVIARGVVGGVWAERKRRRTIDELKDHYIICGFGRVGRRTAAEFTETGVDFVVLDVSPASTACPASTGAARTTMTCTPPVSIARAGSSRRATRTPTTSTSPSRPVRCARTC
jgi:voltage-gated potassium channel